MEPRYPLSSAEFKMDNVGQDIDDSDVYSTPASASLPEGKRPPAGLFSFNYYAYYALRFPVGRCLYTRHIELPVLRLGCPLTEW